VAAKRKMEKRDRTARRKQELMHGSEFHGAKTLAFNDLALKNSRNWRLEIATYKRSLLKCTTFTILCVQIAGF
jgi:hypothetical protein